MLAWINQLRCRVAYWLANCGHPKGLGLGLSIAPDTTSLIRHRRRRPPPLIVPKRSHLVYHQQTVDRQAAINCLKTLKPQLPKEDEVLFLDIGETFGTSAQEFLKGHEWFSYSSAKASLPEQQSYTYGLNLGMRTLKGERLFVWRTDYIYPENMMGVYLSQNQKTKFCSPYEVLVGAPEVDGEFVAKNWDKVSPFDEKFWRAKSQSVSLYETQDPALFSIERELWEKIGGLNHELWGYGWQFAEFAARVRINCPTYKISYFQSAPPLHQTHDGTLMHHDSKKDKQAASGIDRFSHFLGGKEAYWLYRSKQVLPKNRKV
jgi:hypothetical protein